MNTEAPKILDLDEGDNLTAKSSRIENALDTHNPGNDPRILKEERVQQ